MPPDILGPESLTRDALVAVVDAAGFARDRASEPNLVIQGQHQFSLVLDEQHPPRFIRFLAVFTLPDTLGREQALAAVNEVNEGRLAIRATLSEDRLVFDYYLWTADGGVTRDGLVAVTNLFSTALADAVGMVAKRL